MVWRLVGAVTTLFFVISAQAQEPGVYVGGSYGRSKTKIDTAPYEASLVNNPHTPVTVANDSASVHKFFLGYRINEYFAVEGTYASDLGSFTANTNFTFQIGFVPGPPTTVVLSQGNFTVTPRQVLYLSGVAGVPFLQRGLLYARLGAYHTQVEAATSNTNTGSSPTKVSDSSVGPVFGAGVQYDITAHIGIRTEWERFKNVGGSDTGKSDFDLITAGLIYRF
jgi:OOP family OmpA-OmpF porin